MQHIQIRPAHQIIELKQPQLLLKKIQIKDPTYVYVLLNSDQVSVVSFVNYNILTPFLTICWCKGHIIYQYDEWNFLIHEVK